MTSFALNCFCGFFSVKYFQIRAFKILKSIKQFFKYHFVIRNGYNYATPMLKQPKKRGSFCRRFIGDNGGSEHLRRITLTGRGEITKSRITRTVLPRCLVVRGGENGGQRAEQMILGLLLRSACTIILDFYFTMYCNGEVASRTVLRSR